MSYQKDRDEFIGAMVEEMESIGRTLPPENRKGDGVTLARQILRDASTMQRLAEEACNRELSGRERNNEEVCGQRIADLCRPYGIKANFNGDPRGAVVKLILPSGRWNSFGGQEDGYCVPT